MKNDIDSQRLNNNKIISNYLMITFVRKNSFLKSEIMTVIMFNFQRHLFQLSITQLKILHN